MSIHVGIHVANFFALYTLSTLSVTRCFGDLCGHMCPEMLKMYTGLYNVDCEKAEILQEN